MCGRNTYDVISNLFRFFIGKERTNMAVSQGRRNSKQKGIYCTDIDHNYQTEPAKSGQLASSLGFPFNPLTELKRKGSLPIQPAADNFTLCYTTLN